MSKDVENITDKNEDENSNDEKEDVYVLPAIKIKKKFYRRESNGYKVC